MFVAVFQTARTSDGKYGVLMREDQIAELVDELGRLVVHRSDMHNVGSSITRSWASLPVSVRRLHSGRTRGRPCRTGCRRTRCGSPMTTASESRAGLFTASSAAGGWQRDSPSILRFDNPFAAAWFPR
jgi:hypothetical protein